MDTLNLPRSIVPAKLDEYRARKPGQPGEYESDAVLDGLAEAGKKVSEVCQRIAAIAEAVSADETRPEAERARLVRERAKPLGAQAVQALEAAVAKCRKEIAAIDRATAKPEPPTSALNTQLEGEVRARFAAMNDKTRREAMTAALKNDDVLVLGAVLRAPAFLSGFGPADQALFRQQWQKANFPAEIARRDALARATTLAEDTWGLRSLMPFLERAMNLSGAEKAERAAKRAAEVLDAAE